MIVVTVILPCYNASKSIADSITSITNQTFTDWELIVVDDASTDRSVQIVKNFQDTRIKLIQLENNGGYPVAMNAGIAVSQGKYIARMDADDICLPQRLEEQLKALQQFPDASMCGLNRFRITPGGQMFCDRNLPKEKYILETWAMLMENKRIFTDPSVMLEKERVLAVGGYRTFQRSGMDVDLWLRVMEKFGSCITITQLFFGKRLEPGALIFKPETVLINQIPRALAIQRKENGQDDIELGKKIDAEDFISKGLIKRGSAEDKINLMHGAAVSCLMFRDLKGARIYIKHIWKGQKGFISAIMLALNILKKLIYRVKNNPFQRFTLPL